MPITIVCPKCSAKLNAPDAAAGKRVKCPKAGCGMVIAVPAPEPPSFEVADDAPKSQPAAKKTARAAIENEVPPKKKIQKSRDEDEEEEQPKSNLKKARMDNDEEERPKSKRRREEDTEEEERPKSKRRLDDDDEEDENDDRPRKKKKKKSGGIPPVAIVGIVLGVLVVVGGAGYAIYALAFSDNNDSKTTSNSNSGGGGSGGGGASTPRKGVPPPGWVEFKDEQSGFKAYFPGKPKEEKMDDMKAYEFEDKATKDSCVVMVHTPPIAILPDKRKEAGESILKLILNMNGAKELSHNETTLAGQPATEYTFEAPPDQPPSKGPGKGPNSKNKSDKKGGEQNPGRGLFRLLVTEKKVYIVGLTSDTGMPKADWTSGFFDNFELLN